MKAPAPARARLAALVRLLSSDRDGEVIAAARAIGRLLAAQGASWHDLAAMLTGEAAPAGAPLSDHPRRRDAGRAADASDDPPPPGARWPQLARWCARRADRLSDRDAAFVRSLAFGGYRGRLLSAAQRDWLDDIAAHILAAEAAP